MMRTNSIYRDGGGVVYDVRGGEAYEKASQTRGHQNTLQTGEEEPWRA